MPTASLRLQPNQRSEKSNHRLRIAAFPVKCLGDLIIMRSSVSKDKNRLPYHEDSSILPRFALFGERWLELLELFILFRVKSLQQITALPHGLPVASS